MWNTIRHIWFSIVIWWIGFEHLSKKKNSFIRYYVEISISCSLKIVVLMGMQSGDDTIVCFIPEMK